MNKKRLQGKIVSDKMDKTVVVLVSRYTPHPKYKKFIVKSKKYKAHDEKNAYKTGETVTIEETRPISKDKTFIVIGKVEEMKKVEKFTPIITPASNKVNI